jgi:kynurenine formamidase
VYDLAQPYFVGMPHFPTHPPFLFSLTKKHGEFKYDGGGSSAAESIAMSGHTGTHIDALCHFSCNGFFYGGTAVDGAQEYSGITYAHAGSVQPIVRRGVLFDVADSSVLDADVEITAEMLERSQRAEMRPGDVALIRTGWAQYFEQGARFVNAGKMPGVGIAGARWLTSRGVFAAGSDTLAFEKVPSSEMPVHVHLLVESGVHIIEVLNLEELARDAMWEFTFVAAPLKIIGATGAPVRPMAFPRGKVVDVRA